MGCKWRLCVAPMMDWTDRHCRFFLRLVTRHTRLYTEMVTTGALLHGNVPRHLDFDPAEHPVALQLGVSDPVALAECAKLGESWGYDEINLNVGCPSERVQVGSFGACLALWPSPRWWRIASAQPAAMSVAIPVTVKHRLGLDHSNDYGFVRDFVGTVAAAGCNVFIVHARNAVLKGLSPKENRQVPPLRYEVVHRLKREFSALTIVTNGGLARWDAIEHELASVDGVMLGRAAYHDPWLLAQADGRVFDDPAPGRSRADVLRALTPYAQTELRRGTTLRAIACHVLGLYHGQSGGRSFRRILSDSTKLKDAGPELFLEALAAVEPVAA